MNMDVPVNGPPLQQQDNGGLQFDEDLRDIPQQLEAARPPPPPQPQPNLPAQFPSVLAAPAHPHTTLGPAPGIPVNRAPEQLPALTPLNPDGTPAPPKRPRGRPRKIPGTESRGGTGTPGQPAAPRPRGRPKGSRGRGRGRGRGGRGRGGKRARMSSDEDDFEGDGSETEEDERRSRRGGRGGGAGEDDDDEDDDERVVDLNREVDDDFGEGGRLAATTKFGRKISKPKSFVPTNRPTIHRKKRQATAAAMLPAAVLDANLMCEVCRGGHSPDNNKLVICDSCTRGWHQLCHTPTIQPEVVDSPASWFCAECDAKLAAQRKVEDVTEEERGWTDGRGEEKVVEGAAEVGEGEKKEGEGEVQNLEVGENGELVVVEEEKEKTVETNLGKEDEYGEKVKREWLESLPVKTLVGYILSVEKKFAPLISPGSSSLPIWPPALPSLLHEAAVARQQEAADRERKLELEAEELAAAQNILLSGSNMGTPLAGAESQPASEAGTPLGYEQFTTQEPVGARTAASRRAELQAAAAAEQQQQQQPVASTSSSSSASPYASQQGYPVASTSTSSSNGFQPQQPPQQQQHHIPPFHRPALTPVSALQAAAAAGGPSSSLSSVSPAGSPAPMADIPVGAASSPGGARATYSAYPPGYSAPAAAANSNPYTAAAAMAAMGYPGAQYANQFATGIGAGPGVGVGGTPEWAQQGGAGQGMQRGGSGQAQ